MNGGRIGFGPNLTKYHLPVIIIMVVSGEGVTREGAPAAHNLPKRREAVMQIRISKPKKGVVDLLVLPGRSLHAPPKQLCRVKLSEVEACVREQLGELTGGDVHP